jgi:hypothetical protein
MTPCPSKLNLRSLGEENDAAIGPNVDTECFSIYQEDQIIHLCDWPSARAIIDQFMSDRAKEATNAHDV